MNLSGANVVSSSTIKGAPLRSDWHLPAMTANGATPDRRTAKSIAFGKRVLFARKQKGLTQDELARAIKVTENAVTQYETGRAMPRPAKLEQMARTLGVTTTWLLTGDEPDELTRAQTTVEMDTLAAIRSAPLEQQPMILAALQGMVTNITKK